MKARPIETRLRAYLSDFDLDSAVERLVLVSVDVDGKATYLLYGNGLDRAKILVPAGLEHRGDRQRGTRPDCEDRHYKRNPETNEEDRPSKDG
jgi:hypothetical protein